MSLSQRCLTPGAPLKVSSNIVPTYWSLSQLSPAHCLIAGAALFLTQPLHDRPFSDTEKAGERTDGRTSHSDARFVQLSDVSCIAPVFTEPYCIKVLRQTPIKWTAGHHSHRCFESVPAPQELSIGSLTAMVKCLLVSREC